MIQHTAQVAGVYCCLSHEKVTSEKCEYLQLRQEGIRGEKHFGFTKKAGVREKAFAKPGEIVLNLRKVSIVSTAELEEIGRKMRLPKIHAEDLGANILLDGIDGLSLLPAGTYLIFSRGAVLYVTAENLPCMGPARAIQARHEKSENPLQQSVSFGSFPKIALHRRGVVATIFKPGVIRPGDSVKIRCAQEQPE